jgi:hypothetical protein
VGSELRPVMERIQQCMREKTIVACQVAALARLCLLLLLLLLLLLSEDRSILLCVSCSNIYGGVRSCTFIIVQHTKPEIVHSY